MRAEPDRDDGQRGQQATANIQKHPYLLPCSDSVMVVALQTSFLTVTGQPMASYTNQSSYKFTCRLWRLTSKTQRQDLQRPEPGLLPPHQWKHHLLQTTGILKGNTQASDTSSLCCQKSVRVLMRSCYGCSLIGDLSDLGGWRNRWKSSSTQL